MIFNDFYYVTLLPLLWSNFLRVIAIRVNKNKLMLMPQEIWKPWRVNALTYNGPQVTVPFKFTVPTSGLILIVWVVKSFFFSCTRRILCVTVRATRTEESSAQPNTVHVYSTVLIMCTLWTRRSVHVSSTVMIINVYSVNLEDFVCHCPCHPDRRI